MRTRDVIVLYSEKGRGASGAISLHCKDREYPSYFDVIPKQVPLHLLPIPIHLNVLLVCGIGLLPLFTLQFEQYFVMFRKA